MNNIKFVIFILCGFANGMETGSIDTHFLSGKELKVLIINLPSTLVFRNASGEVIGFGGRYYEELLWLSQRLNFSLAMMVEKSNSLGVLVNGTWNGMRGRLQRGDADLACSPFVGAVDSDILELSAYLLGDGFGILGKYPKPEISVFGITNVFSPIVWIGFVLSILVCTGCIKLLEFLHGSIFSHSKYLKTLSATAMFVIASITNHGGSYQTKLRSVGFITLTWCLVSFVFVNIYSSCLTSYMSLTSQRPDINSLKDLATDPNYQLTNLKGTFTERMFMEAEVGIMKAIGDKLRRCNDECRLTSFPPIVDKIFGKQPYVAVIPLTTSDNYMLSTMKNRQCRLTIGQETMTFQHMHMACPKNSPYAMELKKASILWHSLGLHTYWAKKANPVARQCHLSYNSQGVYVELVDQARIKLKQFYLAFIVLFIGYVLACVQFARERFTNFTT